MQLSVLSLFINTNWHYGCWSPVSVGLLSGHSKRRRLEVTENGSDDHCLCLSLTNKGSLIAVSELYDSCTPLNVRRPDNYSRGSAGLNVAVWDGRYTVRRTQCLCG